MHSLQEALQQNTADACDKSVAGFKVTLVWWASDQSIKSRKREHTITATSSSMDHILKILQTKIVILLLKLEILDHWTVYLEWDGTVLRKRNQFSDGMASIVHEGKVNFRVLIFNQTFKDKC